MLKAGSSREELRNAINIALSFLVKEWFTGENFYLLFLYVLVQRYL